MSYRATNQVETVCDRCGKVKAPSGERPWSLWITPQGHTWHHCPKCLDEIDQQVLDESEQPSWDGR